MSPCHELLGWHCTAIQKGSSTETTVKTDLQIQSVMLPGEISPHWALGCYWTWQLLRPHKRHHSGDLCPPVTNIYVWKPQERLTIPEAPNVSKWLQTSWLMSNNTHNHAYRVDVQETQCSLNPCCFQGKSCPSINKVPQSFYIKLSM